MWHAGTGWGCASQSLVLILLRPHLEVSNMWPCRKGGSSDKLPGKHLLQCLLCTACPSNRCLHDAVHTLPAVALVIVSGDVALL